MASLLLVLIEGVTHFSIITEMKCLLQQKVSLPNVHTLHNVTCRMHAIASVVCSGPSKHIIQRVMLLWIWLRHSFMPGIDK